MSGWLLVWLVIVLVTTVVLAAVLIALGRHFLILGRTARRFQEEVQPVADEISRESQRASARAASLQVPSRRSGPGRPRN